MKYDRKIRVYSWLCKIFFYWEGLFLARAFHYQEKVNDLYQQQIAWGKNQHE